MDYSVIPVRNDGSKKAFVKWAEFQNRKATEEEIRRWWEKWPDANIGIVTGEISNLTVMDLDWHKMTESEKVAAHESFPEVATSIVISPRKGEHRYFEYHPDVPTTAGIIPHVDLRNDRAYIIAPPSKNGVGQYKWKERAKISSMPPRLAPASYIKLINSLSIGDVTKYKDGRYIPLHPVTSRYINFKEGYRDNTLFYIASYLVKSGMPTEEIEQLLSVIASQVCNPPFPEKEIPIKINSALKQSERKEKNIAQEIREWVSVTSGYFLVTDCYSELQLVTKKEKTACRIALLRLMEDGLIERYGEKRGCYRLKDVGEEPVDINEVGEQDILDIHLPFGFERYIEIMPKDLIVYAGTPNSGKSALMLETVRINMKRYQCFYFSSEMGKTACKRRLKKYQGDIKWNFKINDNFPNFVDIVKPDDINFIDYLEVKEGEFYKIPSLLGEIQRKLRSGVAFVALQKNPDKDYGVGGQQTKGKPALFLSIDAAYPNNILKVVKAKNYVGENPNGYQIQFKIVNGINLMPSGIWEPEI
jgi:hypothetical protein